MWVVQGQPARCNVYFIEDENGVTMFDAGARTMTRALARAGAKLGGIRRIVLGHGHTDHRGAAPGIGAPVFCHPDEVQDAEGSGGFRYWPEGLSGLPFPHRQAQRLMHRYAWDGGPVDIAGTVAEGDEIAGFTVVEIPGHAPGQIALWRESDRLALSSDCFYTLDIWGRDSEAHLPFADLQLRHRAGARQHAQARRAGARSRLARARQAAHRRRALAARARRRSLERLRPAWASALASGSGAVRPSAAAPARAPATRCAPPAATTQTRRATCWCCAAR